MRKIDRTIFQLDSVTLGKLAVSAADLAAKRVATVASGLSITSDDFEQTYSLAEIRRLLWLAQENKCCYCEKDIEVSFQHVDHHRPKTRARRDPEVPATYQEGYWWLAYEPDNLLFACQGCNTNKSDWFPLSVGSPVGNSATGTSGELPLLIDPTQEDPSAHLTFVWSKAARKWRIVHKSDRGKRTIEILRLDRDDLDILRDKVVRSFLRHYNEGKVSSGPVSDEEPYTLLRSCLLTWPADQMP